MPRHKESSITDIRSLFVQGGNMNSKPDHQSASFLNENMLNPTHPESLHQTVEASSWFTNGPRFILFLWDFVCPHCFHFNTSHSSWLSSHHLTSCCARSTSCIHPLTCLCTLCPVRKDTGQTFYNTPIFSVSFVIVWCSMCLCGLFFCIDQFYLLISSGNSTCQTRSSSSQLLTGLCPLTVSSSVQEPVDAEGNCPHWHLGFLCSNSKRKTDTADS